MCSRRDYARNKVHRTRAKGNIAFMDANEFTRQIQNLIRRGTISAVDLDAQKCRVKSGELETNFIDWMTLRAGAARTWNPPTEGEQVLLLSPGGDPAQGIALCGLYSEAAPAPSNAAGEDSTHYPDGAVIKYDAASSTLDATLPAGGKASITAPGSITVNSPDVTVNGETVTLNAENTICKGNLLVEKQLAFNGGMKGKAGAGGGATAVLEGTLEVTEDAVIGGKPFLPHSHQEQGDGKPVGPVL
jgi:phage baseplate assembly protein V